MSTSKFGTDEVKKQRDQMKGDAKDLVMGKGASKADASAMAKGKALPGKGKSFSC